MQIYIYVPTRFIEQFMAKRRDDLESVIKPRIPEGEKVWAYEPKLTEPMGSYLMVAVDPELMQEIIDSGQILMN